MKQGMLFENFGKKTTDVEHYKDFEGKTYSRERDQMRLNGLMNRVYAYMMDLDWHTLKEISVFCSGSEASVSARLRDLRKEKWGRHTVERKRIGPGLFAYRMIL
jgi:redox-regulated HSP33 family molecular chaperone